MSAIALRRLILVAGLASLSVGVAGGLARLGLVTAPPSAVARHGPAMVGFLGVVVALERAFLLGPASAHVVPLVGVAGLGALLGGAPAWLAHGLLAAAGVGLVVLQGVFVVRRGGVDNALMTAGALAWAAGEGAVAAGAPLFRAVPAWTSFVVLVIVGERVELLRRCGASSALVATGSAVLASHAVAAIVAVRSLDAANVVLGLGWFAAGVVLLAADPGVRAPTRRGPDRYVAAALALGFSWLAVAGLLAVVWPDVHAGPRYDARIHALFGGFALSLLFAHGPQVLPALAGRDGLAWSRATWVALGVLQVAAVGRLLGDLGAPALRTFGTALHAAALLAFVVAMVRGLARLTPPRALRF